MRPHRGIFSASTESVVQLLLRINKGFVCALSKVYVPKDGTSDEWSDVFDLDKILKTDGSMVIDVVG